MIRISRVSRQAFDQNIGLVPASQFTIEELTNAYNQTRVDYLVPMPMNAARLAAYINIYNVDMDHSWVAVDGDEILGLAMLGVRPGRTWITRLGVIPNRRRHGTGESMLRSLLEDARDLGRPVSKLEVIKGNLPAHTLFHKVGFNEVRDLLILRRPPGLPPVEASGKATFLEKEEAMDLLCSFPTRLAWTNEMESFLNAGDALGLEVKTGMGGRGWMVFRRQKFLLSHFILHSQTGDPQDVAASLVAHLYQRFPQIDTYIENIPYDDPHLPVLLQMGFLEVFRRVEMEWQAEVSMPESDEFIGKG
jgi:ribosomal protein S18 acetylase RimI-like enzyme